MLNLKSKAKSDLLLKFTIYFGTICGAAVIFSILILLIFLGIPFFKESGLSIFFDTWNPAKGKYGILPMIYTTFIIAVPAVFAGFFLSLGFACFAASTGHRLLKKPAIALIRTASAIPTIVYAFIGVFLIVPFIRNIGATGSGYSILSASLMLALLISPTMIFFFYDSIIKSLKSLKTGGLVLGATKTETLLYLVIPNAKNGIYSGLFLGMGRAIGDTMISLMLAGNSISFPLSPFESGRTLTAHIGLVMAADYDSPEFGSIFACGILLYLITAVLSILSKLIYKKTGDY